MQRLRIKRTILRVAMTLVVMLFTTASAWAFKTETPVTYTVTYYSNTITIKNGSTPTASWTAKGSGVGVAHYWEADDSHSLSNGMTINPSADVSVTGGSPANTTSTTFTFTAPSGIAITGVTFKNGGDDVAATSSEPGTTFTVTLPASIGFNKFEVTFGYISDKCGTNATWSLAKQNGQYTALTIGGSGAMNDYDAGTTPWGTDLTSVTVGSDITAIGNNAFNGCTALTRVDVQKTDGLVTLGSGVFTGCNALQYIVVPTPALAVGYQTATNWSAHAAKLRVALGSYLFAATDEGGTAAYAITSETDLRNLAAYVNAGGGKAVRDLTFRQTANITLNGNFDPIGYDTDNSWTMGTYDGGGYTISSLSVSTDHCRAGLFGYIYYATLRGITLVQPSVTTSYSFTSSQTCSVGAIVGYAEHSTIENCHALQPTVSATGTGSGNKRIGGIAGEAVNGSTLTNCCYYGGNAAQANGYGHATGTNVGRARKVTASSGVTVSPALTGGEGSNGFRYGGNDYYREGVTLTLTSDATAPDGYTAVFSAGGNAISGSTYTVNSTDGDVTISVDTDHPHSTGQAVSVAYVDANGESYVADAIALDGTETNLAAGTYFVGLPEVNFDHTVTLDGNVTLILEDGCTMNVGTSSSRIDGHCIKGFEGNDPENATWRDLTITSQSLGDYMGALSVYTSGDDNSGIIAKDLTINGGKVTANSNLGGFCAIGANANLTINGGQVTTSFTTNNNTDIEASISSNADITINGGTVSTACIDTGNLTINGGNVSVTNGNTSYSGIYVAGTITLGWNKLTDRISINASSIITTGEGGTVQVADGKMLHNGSSFLGSGTVSDLDLVNGKTLRPAATAQYTNADGTAAEAVNAILLDGNDTSLPAGNYLATGTLNYTHGITFTGNATLILADYCQMNVGTSGGRIDGRGISGYSGGSHSIDITSQSLGDYMGALSVYTHYDGILANTLTINGGNITADTDCNSCDALYSGLHLTINGGTVSANATGSGAHAIKAYGDVNYNGGNVSATAPNGTAIRSDQGNYTFSWRTPADRITIGATGLFAPNAYKTATFSSLFTDGTTTYSSDLTGTALAALAGKTLYPYEETVAPTASEVDGNYWTTFYCGHTGYKINDGEDACAYTATVDGSTITLHKLGKVIPKNTAVILVGADSEISMTASDETVSDMPDNDLHGVDLRTKKSELGTGTFYVLSKKSGQFGFFEYIGAYIPARKAYLLVSGTEARSLTMTFEDETTEISDALRLNDKGQMTNDNFYDLQGRKIEKPTKGLYIVNGRKVVVK